MIAAMLGGRSQVRIALTGQDPPLRSSHPKQVPEQAPSAHAVLQQSEVVAEHQDRTEGSPRQRDPCRECHLGPTQPSGAGHPDGQGRDVDAEYIQVALLQVQGVAPCPAADVQDAATSVSQSLPLKGFPRGGGTEVRVALHGVEQAVLTLDDVIASSATEPRVVEGPAEGVPGDRHRPPSLEIPATPPPSALFGFQSRSPNTRSLL